MTASNYCAATCGACQARSTVAFRGELPANNLQCRPCGCRLLRLEPTPPPSWLQPLWWRLWELPPSMQLHLPVVRPQPTRLPPPPLSLLLCSGLQESRTAGCCALAGAEDVPPPGLLSCAEQAAWGMCAALKEPGFCAVTCGACTLNSTNAGPCDDVATPDGVPCSEVGGTAQPARHLCTRWRGAAKLQQGAGRQAVPHTPSPPAASPHAPCRRLPPASAAAPTSRRAATAVQPAPLASPPPQPPCAATWALPTA